MDALLIIILIIAVLALLGGAFRPAPPPQIIYVQPVTPEPVIYGDLGCLPWMIGVLVLLVILGVIKF